MKFSFFFFACEKHLIKCSEKTNFDYINQSNQYNYINIFNSFIYYSFKVQNIQSDIILNLLHFFYYELIKLKTLLLSSSFLKKSNNNYNYEKYTILVSDCAYNINTIKK